MPETLRRYTDLGSTIHLLNRRSITLLNPATWDDKNDSYYMAEFKRLSVFKTVLALCFTARPETYHHWRVFAGGSDGVRIEFDRQKLISTFEDDLGIRMGPVNYRKISSSNGSSPLTADELPFVKRLPYRDEEEFRIIYFDKDHTCPFRDFPINISWISRITLSPWMPEPFRHSVRKTLRSIPGCSKLKIFQSTLVSNDAWMAQTRRIRPQTNKESRRRKYQR